MKHLAILLALVFLVGASGGSGIRISGGKLSAADAGGGGGGGACTDGVDCLCDTQVEGSGNLVMCEDFESSKLYEAGTNSWIDHVGAGWPCYRGGSSHWVGRYGSAGAGNWSNGQPASPRLGCACDAGGSVCGAREYCSTAQGFLADGGGADCWNGNASGTAIDIQRVGDVADEVAGLTLDENHGGRQWLAYRIGPGSAAGIFGRKEFTTGNLTTFGIRARIAYSTNLSAASNGTFDGDFLTQPWKHEEFTDPHDALLFMGNTGQTQGRPLNPAVIHSSSSACNSAVSGYTQLEGDLDCNNEVMRVGSNFDRSTSWPLGQWACVRAYISGMGTSSATWKIWFNDTLVFHATGVNMTTVNAQNADDWVFNAYYNGNQGGGTASTETFYRYLDDAQVWMNQEPPACSALDTF